MDISVRVVDGLSLRIRGFDLVFQGIEEFIRGVVVHIRGVHIRGVHIRGVHIRGVHVRGVLLRQQMFRWRPWRPYDFVVIPRPLQRGSPAEKLPNKLKVKIVLAW